MSCNTTKKDNTSTPSYNKNSYPCLNYIDPSYSSNNELFKFATDSMWEKKPNDEISTISNDEELSDRESLTQESSNKETSVQESINNPPIRSDNTEEEEEDEDGNDDNKVNDQYYENTTDSIINPSCESKITEHESQIKKRKIGEKLTESNVPNTEHFSLHNKRESTSNKLNNNYAETLIRGSQDSFDNILAQQYTDVSKETKDRHKSDSFLWYDYLDNARNKSGDITTWEKNALFSNNLNNSINNYNNNEEVIKSENEDKSGTLLEQLAAATMAIDKTNSAVDDSDEFVSNEYYSDNINQPLDIKRERFPAPPIGKLVNPEHYGINLTIRGDLVAATDVSEWELPDIEKLKNLRDQLIHFMSDNHLKQADICRFTGLGAPYLSFMVKDPTISNFSSKRRVEVYSVLSAFFRKIENNEVTLEDISRLVLLSKATARASNSKKRVSGFSITDSERSFLIRRRRRGRPQAINGLRSSTMLINSIDNNQFQFEEYSSSQEYLQKNDQNETWQNSKFNNADNMKDLSRSLFDNFQNIKENYTSILQQTVDMLKNSQHFTSKQNRPDALIQAFLSFLYKGYMPQLNHISDLLKNDSLQKFIQSEVQRIEPSKLNTNINTSDQNTKQTSSQLINAFAENLMSSSVNKKYPQSYEAFLHTKDQQLYQQKQGLHQAYSSGLPQSNTNSLPRPENSQSVSSNAQSPTDSIKSEPRKNFTFNKHNNSDSVNTEDTQPSNSFQKAYKTSTPIICVASEYNNQPSSNWYQSMKATQKYTEAKYNESENFASETVSLAAEVVTTDDSKPKKETGFHKLIKCTPHVTKPVILSLDRAPPIMHLIRPHLFEYSTSAANQHNGTPRSAQYSNVQISTSGNQDLINNYINDTNQQQSNSSNSQSVTQFHSNHLVNSVQIMMQAQQSGVQSNSFNNLQSQSISSGKKLISAIQSTISQNDKSNKSNEQKVNPEIRFGKNWMTHVDLKISTNSSDLKTPNNNNNEDMDNNKCDSNIILPKNGKVCPIRLQWKHGNVNGDEDVIWDMNETGHTIESFIETYCHDMHLPLNPFLKELVKEFRKQLEAAKTFDTLFHAITQHLASRLRQQQPRVLPGMSRKILLDCYRDGLRVIDVIPWNLCSTTFDAKNLTKKLVSEMCLPPVFFSTMFPALLRAVAKEKMKFVYECLELLKNTLQEEITFSQPFGLKVVSEGKKKQATVSPSSSDNNLDSKKTKIDEQGLNFDYNLEENKNNFQEHFKNDKTSIGLLSAVLSSIPELTNSVVINSSSKYEDREHDSVLNEGKTNTVSREEKKEKFMKTIGESLSNSERFLNCHEDANTLKQLELRTPIILQNTYPNGPLSRHIIDNVLSTENYIKPNNDLMYLDSSQDLLDSSRFRRQKII